MVNVWNQFHLEFFSGKISILCIYVTDILQMFMVKLNEDFMSIDDHST